MKITTVIKHCLRHKSSHFLLELLPYFAKHHEVHVFTGEWNDVKNKRVFFHKIPVFFSNFYLQEILFTVISTIVMKFQSFDLTWAQPTRYLSPDIAHMEFCYKGWAEYKKKMGLPLNIQDILSHVIEGYNLNKARHIIATSIGIKREIMKFYGIPENKITLIPNGVNTNKFKPDKKKRIKFRKKFGVSQRDIVLLFVGRNLKRKGLKYVIKALHIIKNNKIKLVVCGGDDKEHRNLVNKLKENKRVMFVGDVKNIDEYYVMADMFVFPTFYEGFSFATLQAASSGLPVIATIANGTEDLIENGKNGYLLKTRKPEVIANKIKLLVKNNNLRKKMSRRAREIAVKKFSWSVVAKQILNVFEKVKCD